MIYVIKPYHTPKSPVQIQHVYKHTKDYLWVKVRYMKGRIATLPLSHLVATGGSEELQKAIDERVFIQFKHHNAVKTKWYEEIRPKNWPEELAKKHALASGAYPLDYWTLIENSS